MNLPLGTFELSKNLLSQPKKSEPKEEKLFVLSVTHTEFANNHLAFWKKLGVQNEFLQRYNVRALANYSFFIPGKNKDLTFTIKDDVLAFSYEVKGIFQIHHFPTKRS